MEMSAKEATTAVAADEEKTKDEIIRQLQMQLNQEKHKNESATTELSQLRKRNVDMVSFSLAYQAHPPHPQGVDEKMGSGWVAPRGTVCMTLSMRIVATQHVSLSPCSPWNQHKLTLHRKNTVEGTVSTLILSHSDPTNPQSQQATAEQEEEMISNRLMKRLAELKLEKVTKGSWISHALLRSENPAHPARHGEHTRLTYLLSFVLRRH